MTLSLVGYTSAGQDTANNTTVTKTVTNVPTVGNWLVLFLRNSNSSASLSSVSDTVNTWTVVHANATNLLSIAFCKVVGSLSGKSITATVSAADANKGFFVVEVAASAGDLTFVDAKSGSVFFNGTNRLQASGNSVSALVGDIVFGFFADSTQETSFTAGSGYTAFPTVTGSGYFSTASIFMEGEYRIAPTATTYAPTATAGGSPVGFSALCAAFREVVATTRPPRPVVTSRVAVARSYNW